MLARHARWRQKPDGSRSGIESLVPLGTNDFGGNAVAAVGGLRSSFCRLLELALPAAAAGALAGYAQFGSSRRRQADASGRLTAGTLCCPRLRGYLLGACAGCATGTAAATAASGATGGAAGRGQMAGTP